MTERKVGTLEESISASQDALRKVIAEASSDEERLSYGLRLAVEPAWATWIKESGATPPQIARAVIELASSLIAETAKNIGKPGEQIALAQKMGLNVAEKAAYYVSDASTIIAEVPAFHRRDA